MCHTEERGACFFLGERVRGIRSDSKCIFFQCNQFQSHAHRDLLENRLPFREKRIPYEKKRDQVNNDVLFPRRRELGFFSTFGYCNALSCSFLLVEAFPHPVSTILWSIQAVTSRT